MTLLRSLILLLASALLTGQTLAGEPSTGPVITGYGPVYAVPDAGFKVDTGAQWKVVFDVAGRPDDAGARNRELESVARFINMQARAGVPPEQMDLAVVIHGAATEDTLSHDRYRQRHQVDNPSAALIRQLHAQGVALWLCGQSAASRGIAPDELLDEVGLALSAMTVLSQLQREGYTLQP